MPEMQTPGTHDEGLLNHERSFVETLVQQFQQSTIIPPRKRSRLPDLVKINLRSYEVWIEKAHQHYQELSASDSNISLTAEWILDNYYILQQAFHLIREDMPSGYQKQLPRLMHPLYKGFPRIFALIRSLLHRQSYLLDLDDIHKTLNEFQEQVPLTMGELWSIPIFIRFGLIEKLAHVLFEELKPDERFELDNFPPISPGSSLPASEKAQGEAKDQVGIVAGIVRSLRMISENNWEDVFESLSLVEKTLRQDPAGIYPDMDFKTRNLYRGEIEKLAKLTGEDETRLAISLLDLCHQSSHIDSGLVQDHPAAEHIGTFLIGGRRGEFEKIIGYKPGLKARIVRQARRWNTPLYLGSISLIAAGLIAAILQLAHTMVFFETLGFFQFLLMFAVTLCLIPPAFIVANHLVNIALGAFGSPSLLPKLEFKKAVPEAYKTLVAIPGMLSNTRDIENLVRQIEVHYLSNPQPGLKYAVLTDFSDADSQTRPEDECLVDQAFKAMAELDQKYRQDRGQDEQLFFLFHRQRLWNPSQGKWMGWERKRGKLHELGRFLRGDDDTSFLELSANEKVRQQIGTTSPDPRRRRCTRRPGLPGPCSLPGASALPARVSALTTLNWISHPPRSK